MRNTGVAGPPCSATFLNPLFPASRDQYPDTHRQDGVLTVSTLRDIYTERVEVVADLQELLVEVLNE